MTRFHFPRPAIEPWRLALADPVKHWKDGKSAKELATSWVDAEATPRGLPPKVAALLDTVPSLAGATLLLGIPEHKVELPSPGRPSQNDLWAILRSPAGLVSLAVEGKSGEPFDRPLEEWLKDASPGKNARLAGLCDLLGATSAPPGNLMYQLFHRTASAILEAERWGLQEAMMLVHSFGGSTDYQSETHLTQFADWLDLSQASVRQRTLRSGITLSLGWVADEPA